MSAGRYAPSPTGDLHLGNLRTALLAWLWARSTNRDFYLRLEDLDRGRARDPQSQIDDLRAIGIDWDGPIVTQSERTDLYEDALATLTRQGQVFECFCSRKDIREAASAAHTPPSAYPGTCYLLSEKERELRRSEMASRGLRPALRLLPRRNPDSELLSVWHPGSPSNLQSDRATTRRKNTAKSPLSDWQTRRGEPGAGRTGMAWTILDELHGEYTGLVESVVLQRGDGAFAYNLAVVVDDLAMGVDQVVRGDDLLESAPTQAYLAQQLGGWQPNYVHVPLVLGPTGVRLAKRDGAVTLRELWEAGFSTEEVLLALAQSINPEASTAEELLADFNPGEVPRTPCRFEPPLSLEPCLEAHRPSSSQHS
ncbi:tRNA glutamyl-Q(34) synthetase GluQRS [Actinomycetaceae bacterium MB13-C1-2]|nr:tRNA glutamyl-Q(34) synthetase GluQRS [Actinomycetaceae bacterium MB13-C1-2]